MARKRKERVICFMHCGSLTCSCPGLRMIKIGHCSAPMLLEGYLMSMAMNLMPCMKNKKKKG